MIPMLLYMVLKKNTGKAFSASDKSIAPSYSARPEIAPEMTLVALSALENDIQITKKSVK